MRIPVLGIVGLLAAPLLVAGIVSGLSGLALPASAQSVTGAVTGQVVWGAPVPVPYGVPGTSEPGMAPESSEVAPSEVAPNVYPEPMPGETPGGESGRGESGPGVQVVPAPGRPVPVRPPVPRPIPAGAVLVAVQGTSLSARTDESGRFRIEGVPVGQYLTVAAGPVRGVSTAFVLRPNVFVPDAGRTVDLGRLSLGQPYVYYGPMPYGAPDASQGLPEEGQ